MRRLMYISFLSILFMGCKSEKFEIENLNGNKIDVLGHAGMGVSDMYPSNSAESILNCLNLGATGSEMDVQMTSDGVLVLFHDESLNQKTDLQGTIYSHTWDEIKDARYDEMPYSNFKIVRLSELIENIEHFEDYIFTFDIKLYYDPLNYEAQFEQFSDAIVNLFNENNLHSHVYIESQSTLFLSLLQSKASNIDLYYYPQTFQDGIASALSLNLKGISISTFSITKEEVQQAHDAGIFVTIWNIKTKEDNIEAIHKNPDMIQTDKVKYLVDILSKQQLIN